MKADGPLGTVAYHLDISPTSHLPCHDHGPLPVARAHVQLLVGEHGSDLKIEAEPGHPRYVLTVHGVGYRMQ